MEKSKLRPRLGHYDYQNRIEILTNVITLHYSTLILAIM